MSSGLEEQHVPSKEEKEKAEKEEEEEAAKVCRRRKKERKNRGNRRLEAEKAGKSGDSSQSGREVASNSKKSADAAGQVKASRPQVAYVPTKKALKSLKHKKECLQALAGAPADIRTALIHNLDADVLNCISQIAHDAVHNESLPAKLQQRLKKAYRNDPAVKKNLLYIAKGNGRRRSGSASAPHQAKRRATLIRSKIAQHSQIIACLIACLDDFVEKNRKLYEEL